MEPFGLCDVQTGSSTDVRDIRVDIVAVHGLGGQAFRSWTHPNSGTCWVRDLLPDRLPGTRITVFGYNARRLHHNADLNFADVAGQLIAELTRLRAHPEEQNRPIVFLAHSLGGLIAKKAVTLTSNEAKTIASCVRGFVFFATPHCGSSSADLAAVFQKFTRHILDVPHNFLRDLRTKSPELEELNRTFKEFLEGRDIRCISFHESIKSKRGLLPSSIIVTRESARLTVEGEEQICLNADHSNIVRFKNADDSNFKIVADRLKNLVQLIDQRRRRSSQVYVPFRPGKFFVGRKAELSQLESWFLGTERPNFKAVALYGPSGVGKTQLSLKFAIENQDSYDYVFFVNASSQKVLRNEFIKLQKNLKLADGSGDAVIELTNWLVSQTEKRWLFIFDNANSLSDVLWVITPIHAGHVILTTQDARVRNNESINESLEVKVLSPGESQQLLFARSGVGPPKLDDIEVAEALVKELGYLPLAIDSAGAYINVYQKSITEYAELNRDNR